MYILQHTIEKESISLHQLKLNILKFLKIWIFQTITLFCITYILQHTIENEYMAHTYNSEKPRTRDNGFIFVKKKKTIYSMLNEVVIIWIQEPRRDRK